MGKIKIKDKTMPFINSYDYNKIGSVRRAIRGLLKLTADAEMFGSEGAMIILTDIKSGLDQYNSPLKVLTDDQREAINLCFIEDMTVAEAAERMNVAESRIEALINSGVKRIRNYLVTGEMTRPVFTEEETLQIMSFYRRGLTNVDIAVIMNKSPRQIKYKIRSLIASGRLAKRKK